MLCAALITFSCNVLGTIINPWEVVSVDFGGPYPDGHYNLVVIDKRTRYPEVEKLHTTACKQTKEKLKKIFATHGIHLLSFSHSKVTHVVCGFDHFFYSRSRSNNLIQSEYESLCYKTFISDVVIW
jgi:hypothetical protein